MEEAEKGQEVDASEVETQKVDGAVNVSEQPEGLKEEEELDEHRVVADCPCCRKKMRLKDRNVLYIVEQPVIMGPDGKGHPGVPRMACMNCGTIFLPRDMRIHIFNQLTGLGSRIVAPVPGQQLPNLKVVS